MSRKDAILHLREESATASSQFDVSIAEEEERKKETNEALMALGVTEEELK